MSHTACAAAAQQLAPALADHQPQVPGLVGQDGGVGGVPEVLDTVLQHNVHHLIKSLQYAQYCTGGRAREAQAEAAH